MARLPAALLPLLLLLALGRHGAPTAVQAQPAPAAEAEAEASSEGVGGGGIQGYKAAAGARTLACTWGVATGLCLLLSGCRSVGTCSLIITIRGQATTLEMVSTVCRRQAEHTPTLPPPAPADVYHQRQYANVTQLPLHLVRLPPGFRIALYVNQSVPPARSLALSGNSNANVTIVYVGSDETGENGNVRGRSGLGMCVWGAPLSTAALTGWLAGWGVVFVGGKR